MSLIVTRPFGNHSRGDAITDPAEVSAILAGPHRGSVVQLGSAAVAATPEPTVAEAVAAGVAVAEAALHPTK